MEEINKGVGGLIGGVGELIGGVGRVMSTIPEGDSISVATNTRNICRRSVYSVPSGMADEWKIIFEQCSQCANTPALYQCIENSRK